MQACSDLLVAHVGVRRVGRVTVIIVHIGLEGVLVVIHFCVAIFVRELLYQEVFSLHLLPLFLFFSCFHCGAGHVTLVVLFTLLTALITSLKKKEFFVVEGSGWRGRQESDSQVTCHPNLVHACTGIDKRHRCYRTV